MFSKLRFSQKEILNKCTSFEEQKDKTYIPGNIYFAMIVFGCLSSKKTVSQISFNLFCSGDKELFSEFLRKGG